MQQDPISWRRSFTRIDRVELLGTHCAVVIHRDVHPDSQGLNQWEYRADVYLVDERHKLVEDAPLTGRMLAATETAAFVLASEPPEPWTLLRLNLASDSPCR
jgi:hypothetical protein